MLVVAAAPSKPLTITLEARYADEFTSQVAFAKRAPASALSAARPLWQQLSVVALGAGSPVDALAAVLPSALAPLLKSELPLATQTDADRASLRARLDELQRALHRCQQRVEMPELELRVPAAVADAVAAAPTDRGGGEARAAALARDELERRGELGAALEEVERLMPRRLEGSAVWRSCPTSARPSSPRARRSTLSNSGSAPRSTRRWRRRASARPTRGCARSSSKATRMARRPKLSQLEEKEEALRERLASARAYNKDLLRELPLAPLVALGELGALPAARAALVEIFRCVCKESRLELSGFPLRGASQLLRALGRDFTAQLRRVLDEQLLRATHVDCADAHRNCELLFRAWADGARDFEGDRQGATEAPEVGRLSLGRRI